MPAPSSKLKKILWVLSGLFLFSLALLFFFGEDLLRKQIEKQAREKNIRNIQLAEFDQFNFNNISTKDVNFEWTVMDAVEMAGKLGKVNSPGPWKRFNPFIKKHNVSLNNLKLSNEFMKVDVEEITSFYIQENFRSVPNALRIQGFNLSLNLDRIPESQNSSGNPSQTNKREENAFFQDQLSEPTFRFLRFRDFKISTLFEEKSYQLHFETIKANMVRGFHYIEASGNLIGVPFENDLTIWKESNETYILNELNLPDLSQNQEVREIFKEQFKAIPADFNLVSGSMKARKNAKFEENSTNIEESVLSSSFIEINASDLIVDFNESFLEIEKLIAFADGLSPHPMPNELNAYANLNWNDQVELKGAHLRYRNVESNDSIFDHEATLKVWELNGSLGGIDYMVENFSGSLMEWKNENSISELLIDGQEFQFDRVSFSSLFEKFNLIDGKIYLQTGDSVNQLKLKIPSVSLYLPGAQLSFHGLSYNGILNLSDLPLLPEKQKIEVKSLQVGDEFDKFKDIEISFSMASQNQIFIDELAFTYNSKNSKQFVFSPANLSLFQIQEDGENLKIAIDFNNSNCVIYQVYHPEYMGTELDSIQYRTEISGITGRIEIQSLDPFSTKENQFLDFKNIQIEEMEFTDGNLTFSVQEGKTLEINRAIMKGFGGFVGLKETFLRRNKKESEVKFTFDLVNAEQIISILTGIDMKIEGNFSGEIPFAFVRENWDYVGGFLKYVDQGSGYLSLRLLEEIFPFPEVKENPFILFSKKILWSKIKGEDEQAIAMKLAAKALSDLTLEDMRMDFEVKPSGNTIDMKINGVSEVNGAKIFMEYNPTVETNFSSVIFRLFQHFKGMKK